MGEYILDFMHAADGHHGKGRFLEVPKCHERLGAVISPKGRHDQEQGWGVIPDDETFLDHTEFMVLYEFCRNPVPIIEDPSVATRPQGSSWASHPGF